MNNKINICYIGIFDENFSRNAVYIKGLKENGVNVIVCTDHSAGIKKYWDVFEHFMEIRETIDYIVIGYSGHVIVPFVKILSFFIIGKPVIFDALCSFYESNILSRDAFKDIPFRDLICHTVDWFANTFADKILLETEEQKQYYIERLNVPARKCIVAFTGVNDDLFYYDNSIKKLDKFTVLFRGKFTPEAGIKYVIEAADLLKDKNINFRIVGYGHGKINDDIQRQIKDLKLKNLEFINKHLPIEELRKLSQECHISLGQLENHERLLRTIPHKAFEAMVMKIPYITARTKPMQEILEEGKSCLFVNMADSKDLADKIMKLKDDKVLSELLIKNAFDLYQNRFTPKALAKDLLDNIISSAKQ